MDEKPQSAPPIVKKTATALPLLWWPARLTLLFVLTVVLLAIIGDWLGWQLGLALLFWHETLWAGKLKG